ncbi:serine hydrolase [Silvanigrella paludirubra]|uniref:Serine hydrolase n=1 Tax=Silvanigrella paludirubra TaxID=2499159 RepID=A0A6N6VRZ0_9BACT|nr:serine hydrolase [Silvanigrella paludirubra]KAB8038892.1 serine hydrolase [Silvanigrella paludirubra]
MKFIFLTIIFLILEEKAYCKNDFIKIKENFNNDIWSMKKEIQMNYKVDTFSISVFNKSFNEEITNFFYGKNFNNEFIDQDTLFPVASISKIYTADIIDKLVYKNSIHLNDKISKWVKIRSDLENKTVFQLLNNNSLIPNYSNNPLLWSERRKNFSKIFSFNELIGFIKYMEITKNNWQYSNTNYLLLGEIIEIEMKNNLKSVFKNYFNENNMKNSFFEKEKSINNLMFGNEKNEKFSNINVSWLSSAGAVFSTPQEVVISSVKIVNELIQNNKKWVNTKTGKITLNIEETAYLNGVFRMNSPFGIIYFTPGLIPGFTSGFIYSPCLETAIAYSANRSELHKFHAFIIRKIFKNLYHDKTYNLLISKKSKNSNFCEKVAPSEEINFANME